ncbi:MAG: hypothetical protein HY868_12555 [Chloroflexi bacterium]|nr:hypothetical protein [Chloroflexota bacterium]
MFDLTYLKQTSGLDQVVLRQVEQKVQADYPDDAMLFELHLVRVLLALKQGWITLEQILSERVPA